MTNFFNKNLSNSYDEQNKKMAPISDNMHFLTELVLKDLPTQSIILCVGVGTGAEIFSLAKEHPEWKFLGIDPSADMLGVCQERLEEAGIANRCELIQGYGQDIPEGKQFNAVLSILVGHFVKREERLSFYQNMYKSLKTGGYVVNIEISFDLDSPEYPAMLKSWEQVQLVRGATPESVKTLPKQLKEVLTVLPPSDVENIIKDSGFALPIKFFQSFMIMGWYGRKD